MCTMAKEGVVVVWCGECVRSSRERVQVVSKVAVMSAKPGDNLGLVRVQARWNLP